MFAAANIEGVNAGAIVMELVLLPTDGVVAVLLLLLLADTTAVLLEFEAFALVMGWWGLPTETLELVCLLVPFIADTFVTVPMVMFIIEAVPFVT